MIPGRPPQEVPDKEGGGARPGLGKWFVWLRAASGGITRARINYARGIFQRLPLLIKQYS